MPLLLLKTNGKRTLGEHARSHCIEVSDCDASPVLRHDADLQPHSYETRLACTMALGSGQCVSPDKNAATLSAVAFRPQQ